MEKDEELMVMEKEEVEKREVTFVSLVDSMPPAPDTAPTASTVQQGRSAGPQRGIQWRRWPSWGVVVPWGPFP